MPNLDKNFDDSNLIKKYYSKVEKLYRKQANGLLKPLITPIILAVITLLGLNLLSQEFIVHFISYTYQTDTDRRAYLSNRTLEHPPVPTIWHFGGSALQQALDKDYMLESRVDGKLSFINLATSTQTSMESLALMKKVNINNGDLIVVHTSLSRLNRVFPPNKMSCNPENYIFSHRDFVNAHNKFGYHQPGIPMACYLTLFSKHLAIKTILLNLLKGKEYVHDVNYINIPLKKPDNNPQKLKKIHAQAMEIVEQEKFQFHYKLYSARLFKRVVRAMDKYANSKGARLILIDLPVNKDWYKNSYAGKSLQSTLKKYFKEVNELSADGIPYYNFQTNGDFTFNDFNDYVHLSQTGRDKFYPMYMKVVLPFFDGTALKE